MLLIYCFHIMPVTHSRHVEIARLGTLLFVKAYVIDGHTGPVQLEQRNVRVGNIRPLHCLLLLIFKAFLRKRLEFNSDRAFNNL